MTGVWQDDEMREILARMSSLTLALKPSISLMAQTSGQFLNFLLSVLYSVYLSDCLPSANLGSLRQECCYSNTVVGVGDYVQLLKEKTLKLHEKVLDTKKILLDNKVDMERHYTECKECLILQPTERVDIICLQPFLFKFFLQ